jgi:ubiquinone/menaquinone biosynthesis C-methylase UbiE
MEGNSQILKPKEICNPNFYESHIYGQGKITNSEYSIAKLRLERCLTAINSDNGRVLEVGCGAGRFIRAIVRNKPRIEAYGCDISHSGIRIAQNYKSNISYTVCGEYLFPYPDNFFDYVIFFDVLEHVKDTEKFIFECRRVLKRGGKLHIFVPCEGDSLSIWKFIGNFMPYRNLKNIYGGHIHSFSRKQVLKIFRKYGFIEIPRERKYSLHLLGQIADLLLFLFIDFLTNIFGLSQITSNLLIVSKRKNILWFSIILTVDFIIYWEGKLLAKVPGPGMHTTFKCSK